MKLTDQQVRHHISEIISGKRLFHLQCSQLPSQILVFLMPSHQNKLNADITYEATLLRAIYEGIPTRNEMGALLQQNDVLDPRDQEYIERIERELKTVKLLHSRTRSERQRKAESHRIRVLNIVIDNIRERQDAYFFHTAEAKAEQAKTIYLIAQCVQVMEGGAFWSDADTFMGDEREQVQNIVIKEYLKFAKGFDTATIRYIARHYEWRIYWKSCTKTGGELFHGPTTDWDVNKLLLCYWSDYYDNIFNHPKCPGEEILGDDGRCDQWVEDQVRGVGDGAPGMRRGEGTVTIRHDINEPYRLVTAEQYAKEQAAKERMNNG